MSDKDFLLWLADRLVLVYGESEFVDFVHKLKAIAHSLGDNRHTPSCLSFKMGDTTVHLYGDGEPLEGYTQDNEVGYE